MKRKFRPLEIYEHLRMAHQELKEVFRHNNYGSLDEQEKNALESVSGVLYMAEAIFCTEKFQ